MFDAKMVFPAKMVDMKRFSRTGAIAGDMKRRRK